MKTSVAIFGTFDLMHPGHISLINYAGSMGDVNVVLTTDKMVEHYKHKKPLHSFDNRKKRLMKIKGVSAVYPSDELSNSYAVLHKIRPSVVLLGYDQVKMKKAIGDKLRDMGLSSKIVVAKSYRHLIYKSTKLGKLTV